MKSVSIWSAAGYAERIRQNTEVVETTDKSIA